ncbi:hypothetical protein V2J09_016099 [Rumex salicifolius]
MKFCKTYQEYVQQRHQELPVVEFKNLKKILKHCRHVDPESHSDTTTDDVAATASSNCPHECPVCDGTFFPELLKEMSAIVGSFNKHAERLLDVHLATGFKRYYVWCKGKMEKNHSSLIQEGQDLVTYAMINAIAVRKILKKYDKVHCSNQGLAFKSKIQRMHIEILQSPWLCEVMAFYINLREKKLHEDKTNILFEGCSLQFVDGKPSLTCELFNSIKLDIDLTCSICLDTMFDPVALLCGHIFCYICACSSASVTIVDGLKEATPKEKCPLCRESGVFRGPMHLEELNTLLSSSCPEYWEERLQTEKAERIKQAKQHWEAQCRTFVGF